MDVVVVLLPGTLPLSDETWLNGVARRVAADQQRRNGSAREVAEGLEHERRWLAAIHFRVPGSPATLPLTDGDRLAENCKQHNFGAKRQDLPALLVLEELALPGGESEGDEDESDDKGGGQGQEDRPASLRPLRHCPLHEVSLPISLPTR